nr:hypothetical protein [uncultured Rhodopila sp.]
MSDTVDAGRHYTHPEYQKAKRALALARNAAENHAKWRAAHAPDESHAYHRAALRAYAAQDRALDRGISRGGRTLEATIAHAKKGRS